MLEKLTPYLYRIKMKRAILTANHDRVKLCQDREVPVWAQRLSQQIIAGTGTGEGEDQGVSSGNLYCVCRKSYTVEFMIRCEECTEWYHDKGNTRRSRHHGGFYMLGVSETSPGGHIGTEGGNWWYRGRYWGRGKDGEAKRAR